jgi:FMN phosphatase YigB (HAD superfamily)
MNLERIFEHVCKMSQTLYHGSPSKFKKFNFNDGRVIYLTPDLSFAKFYARKGYLYTVEIKENANIFNLKYKRDCNKLRKFLYDEEYQLEYDRLNIFLEEAIKDKRQESIKSITKAIKNLPNHMNKWIKKHLDPSLEELKTDDWLHAGTTNFDRGQFLYAVEELGYDGYFNYENSDDKSFKKMPAVGIFNPNVVEIIKCEHC